MNKKNGVIVSFSGVDGTGKSTQVDLLAKTLKKGGYSVYVTESFFGYFILKPIIALLRKATKSPKSGPVRKNKNSTLLKMWAIPAFIDIWANYLFRVLKLKRRYDFILADRFFNDIWVNLFYYGYLSEALYKNMVNYLPKSDIQIIFDADPTNILRREREFAPKYYYDQRKLYTTLAKLTRNKLTNAEGTPKKVSNRVAEIVSKYEKY